jgi:hypothetical protein
MDDATPAGTTAGCIANLVLSAGAYSGTLKVYVGSSATTYPFTGGDDSDSSSDPPSPEPGKKPAANMASQTSIGGATHKTPSATNKLLENVKATALMRDGSTRTAPTSTWSLSASKKIPAELSKDKNTEITC